MQRTREKERRHSFFNYSGSRWLIKTHDSTIELESSLVFGLGRDREREGETWRARLKILGSVTAAASPTTLKREEQV